LNYDSKKLKTQFFRFASRLLSLVSIPISSSRSNANFHPAMRTFAFAALVASAAAFAPALSGVRTGATSLNMALDKSGRAPVITVFDHRGCTAHKNAEYKGPKANGMEDEQCVKVQSVKITGPDAETVLRDSLATLKK